jgi:cell division protein FtsQ
MAMPLMALAIYFTLLSFSSEKLKEKQFNKVQVKVYPDHLKFIGSSDIRDFLGKNEASTISLGYHELFESYKKLRTNAWLQHACIYQSKPDELMIECNQRRPFFRIQNIEGHHLYVDSLGNFFPAVNDFACKVPFAGGYLFENFNRHNEINIKNQIQKNVSLSKVFHTSDIWNVLNEISKDSLLSVMIQNIYVDKTGEIILIPNVGKHKIYLGKADRLDYKLKKLSIFYKEAYLKSPSALNYSKILLQFKNQIVCTMK